MENKVLSERNNKFGGLKFCASHTGKMTGLQSLSTSPGENPHCVARSKNPDSICSHCFSFQMQNRFADLDKNLRENSRILKTKVNPEDWPVIMVRYFRLEAFGDISSVIQVDNYFELCRRNPKVNFALWTKNLGYIRRAIMNGIAKPENLNIVLSSPATNRPLKSAPDFVDKIFTVYDPKFITANNIRINCGAKSCATCGLCYKKNNVKYINEKLK